MTMIAPAPLRESRSMMQSAASRWLMPAVLCVALGCRALAGPEAVLLKVPAPVPLDERCREVEIPKNVTQLCQLHTGVDGVYRIAVELRAAGREDEACQYLEQGLRADPWNMEQQLVLAELLAGRGHEDEAAAKASMVFKYAEKESELLRALPLLHRSPAGLLPELEPVGGTATVLVLLPVGPVNRFLLEDLQAALSRRLGLEVRVCQGMDSMPEPDRNAYQRLIARRRVALTDLMAKDQPFALWVQGLGIDAATLEVDDAAICRVIRTVIASREGQAAAEAFDLDIRRSKTNAWQWDAEKLLQRVARRVQGCGRSGVFFLGVTEADLYTGDNNFLFGTALNGGPAAIVSARRFYAGANDEPPRRERLCARLLKQSLSSLGFMLSVPRCTSPDCARAYPNSLVEHDAKTDRLCAACKAGFERALGHPLPAD